MRKVIYLLMVGLILGQLLAVGHVYAGSRTVIKSASEYDYPPFCVVTQDGKADGFSVELLGAALSVLNLDVEFKIGEWDILKKELSDRAIQVLPLVARTQEREAIYDFTFPYLTLHGAVFVREGDSRIKQVLDLADKTVMVMRGDAAEEFARRTNISSNIIAVDTYTHAMQMLAAGKYDAVIAQRLMGITLLNKIKINKVVPLDFDLDGFRQDFCFAVRDGDRALLSTLNEGLSIAIANGTFARLHQKWFGPILREPITFKNVLYYVLPIVVLTIVIMIVLSIYFLRAELKRKTKSLVQEINERKLLQEELTRVFDLVPDLICVASMDGYFKKLNQAWEKTLGFTTEELLSKSYVNFIHPDDLHQTMVEVEKQIGKQSTINFINRYLCKDGTYKYLEWNAIPSPDGTFLYAAARDVTDRKQTEEALRESEERFKAITMTASDAIILMDDHGKIIYSNPATERIFGYSTNEADGKDLHLLLAPPRLHEEYNKGFSSFTMNGQGPVINRVVETNAIKKDGTVFPIEVSTAAMNIGGRWHALGIVRDITARKQIEEVQTFLAQTTAGTNDEPFFEKLAGFLARNMCMNFVCIDRLEGDGLTATTLAVWHDGKFEDNVSYALKDTPCGDVVGKTVCCFPSDVSRLFPLDQVLQDLRAESYIGVTLFDHTGKPNGLIAVIGRSPLINRNLAEATLKMVATRAAGELERLNSEKALKESEERFRSLVNGSIEGIMIHNNGVIIDANVAFARLFGYEQPEELIGKNGIDFMLTSESREPIRERMERRAEGIIEVTGIRKDGSTFLAETESRPAQYLGHDARIVSCRNITERKQLEVEKLSLEERLHRSEKMESLGQLAGGVAHDLNNVLGVLTGYSELLVERIPEGNPLREYAAHILNSSEKGAAIIQDLLTLARRGVVASTVTDLNGIVSNLLVTPEFKTLQDYHPHVTIKTDLTGGLLLIKGSPIHLEKTVMNLVSNAAEAIPKEGSVTIRTENRYIDKTVRGYDEVHEGDYVVLTISDTGGGIPAADLDKIFEPFYTKKKMGRSGTGLGLAIVWGTVKDHEGYIDVQSIEGRGGTTFTLYFPVTREKMAEDAAKIPVEQYLGHGESILVVDDVEAQRQVATTLLLNLGYKVDSVSSGESAVEYLKSNTPDILVLDMIMDPGIDGMETYKRILKINPHQKAIIVSGFSETNRVKETQKLGAGAYVKKPYVKETIGVAIRDELARK